MTKLVVIFGFIVAFAAGLVVGMVSRSTSTVTSKSVGAPTRPEGPGGHGGPGGSRGGRGGSFLVEALALDEDQHRQLREIWSAHDGRDPREIFDRRQQLREERDQAIAALFEGEDKARFDSIHETYKAQIEALDREMRERFEDKVNRTKAILKPEQRAKYEELMKQRQFDRGGPRGRGGGDRTGGPPPTESGRQGDDRATPRPALTPQP